MNYFKTPNTIEVELPETVIYESSTNTEVVVADTDDEAYLAEMRALLHAYFRPLENGLSADDVAESLKEDNGTFEAFLRENCCIADREELIAKMERPCPPDAKIRSVTVDKAALSQFDDIAV